MATQLNLIQDNAKDKGATKIQGAVEELSYLMNFNQKASVLQWPEQCRTFQSYLDHVKLGIKHNTLANLRNALLHLVAPRS